MLFLLLLACHDLRVDAKEPVDVDNSSDPNGTDSTSPNASPEVCDDRDNDGDGVVDEDAADAPTWYLDADDDGYGASDQSLLSCDQPASYVTVPGDCNDQDSAYSPAAFEEDCTDPNDYNCDGSTGYSDSDADGFPACEDCNDADAATNPNAEESCDDADNDCDGDIDEGAIDTATWFEDLDGDGYGSGAGIVACDATTGWVGNALDCDDATTKIHPGAQEYCGGLDEDCDGQIDEGALDALTWYLDADGDGAGRTDYTKQSCAEGEGWSRTGDDCNDLDAAVLGPTKWYTDADGDGFGDASTVQSACTPPADTTADGSDADDTDAATYSGAPEICDGLDNDGDGQTDEAPDSVFWYTDQDGDGYGDPATAQNLCTAPADTVANAEDCDDLLAAVSPVGIENCNSIDDDCDGTVDEGATDALPWFRDQDDDGSGDPALISYSCEAPAGYVENSEDCAVTEADLPVLWYTDADGDGDGDPALSRVGCAANAGEVSPGGDCDDQDAARSSLSPELCSDNIDNDCDGQTDEDRSTWYRDDDGDGYGDPGSSVTACAAPAGFVIDNTDCDDNFALYNPGASERCDGVDNNCDGTIDEDSAIDATLWYADADGDGYGDPSSADTSTTCTVPTGYGPGTDCNDADNTVFPAAPEFCDGQPNDCDSQATWSTWQSTDEDGAVTLIGLDGVPEDMTSTFAAGTATTPLAWTMDVDGELMFCDGTYYVSLTVDTTEATVQGLNGAGLTVLDGGGVDRVVYVAANTDALVEGVTVQDGYSTYCAGILASSAFLDLENVVVTSNTAEYYGGGICVGRSEVNIYNSEISSNRANGAAGGPSSVNGYSGGIHVSRSNVAIADTTIQSNYAAQVGGGLYYYGEGTSLSMIRPFIYGNIAGQDSGGAFIFLRQADGRSGTWICEGTPGDRNSGFVGNLAQVGSVDGVTLSDAILDNRGCDFQDQQWDFRLCRHSSCSGSSITLFDSTDLTNTCSSDTQTCY